MRIWIGCFVGFSVNKKLEELSYRWIGCVVNVRCNLYKFQFNQSAVDAVESIRPTFAEDAGFALVLGSLQCFLLGISVLEIIYWRNVQRRSLVYR